MSPGGSASCQSTSRRGKLAGAPCIPARDLPLWGRPEPAHCPPPGADAPQEAASSSRGRLWRSLRVHFPLWGHFPMGTQGKQPSLSQGAAGKVEGTICKPWHLGECSPRGIPRGERELPSTCWPCNWAAGRGTPRDMQSWTTGPSQIQGPGPVLSPQRLRAP